MNNRKVQALLRLFSRLHGGLGWRAKNSNPLLSILSPPLTKLLCCLDSRLTLKAFLGRAVSNRRQTESCFSQDFSFKIGSFDPIIFHALLNMVRLASLLKTRAYMHD
jgi:hypothetical protein